MKRIAFVGTKFNDERNIIKCLTIKINQEGLVVIAKGKSSSMKVERTERPRHIFEDVFFPFF